VIGAHLRVRAVAVVEEQRKKKKKKKREKWGRGTNCEEK
jgi:hypothetical protein